MQNTNTKETKIPNAAGHDTRVKVLLAEDLTFKVSVAWFEASFWQQQKKIVGQSVGRSTTYFFQEGEQIYVLRHYFRGGLIRKISRDKYVYLGVQKTRAYRELRLLERLKKLGLPVPTPIAARIKTRGLLYTADLIMEKIPDAMDVYHQLRLGPISEETYRHIGRRIRDFHEHNVFHADLNIHNIMLDDNGKVWLIDFDRGDVRPKAGAWQRKNMERLLSSFEKEKRKHPELSWEYADWQSLLAGYRG